MPALAAIFLSRTALEVYAVIALGLFLLGLKHGYDERRRDEGRIEVRTKEVAPLKADLLTEQQSNATLRKAVNEQADAVQRSVDAAKRAKAAADAANKQADDDAVFYTERLKGLQESLAHPSENPNADTDRILRDLARDRLRVN